MNLEALLPYFEYIQVASKTPSSKAELDHWLWQHIRSIPFENITALVGHSVPIELDEIVKKFTTGRGGYCFEHGSLFEAALNALKLPYRVILGRVYLAPPPFGDVPRTHQLFEVSIGGELYLVDPGFGGPGLREALLIKDGSTSHSQNRIIELELKGANAKLWSHPNPEAPAGSFGERPSFLLYLFSTDAVQPSDIMIANHFTSCHPNSKFIHHLIVQRAYEGGHAALFDRQYRKILNDERIEKTLSPDELLDILKQEFELKIDAPSLAFLKDWAQRN